MTFRRGIITTVAAGILLVITGIAFSKANPQYIFSSLYINGIFWTGVSLFGSFFIALNYASGAAWIVPFFRILEGMGAFLPLPLAIIALIILLNILNISHIFHWMDNNIAAKDPLIRWKSPYLNIPFFIIRWLIISLIWVGFTRWLQRINKSYHQTNSIENYYRGRKVSALYLLLIVITAPVAAWDWLLSIDVHWFSTIFGWYVFASWWISGLAIFALLALSPQPAHHLLTKEHLHNISKWMFAVALVWCYAFYFQFMLIWYAHLPEEITYFQIRLKEYPLLFWGIFAINFFIPFFLLMDRDAKRNPAIVRIVAIALIAGHWLNTYLSVVPSVFIDKATPSLLILSAGFFALFLSLFLWRCGEYLKKTYPEIHYHPLLEEALHYKSDAR